MGISSEIGNPTQLSEGQRGLFNTLGASLAPMPAVNPDDPASLRAAAAEAMRRGDAQQARIYAVMASERENSVREKNASQNALLDEGNAEIQAELARKQGILTNRSNAAAYERFLEPDLLQAVKMGQIPVATAMKEQQARTLAAQKEQGANQRAARKEAGANARAQLQYGDEGAYKPQSSFAKEAIDLGYAPGSEAFNQHILGRGKPRGAITPTVDRIAKDPSIDRKRLDKARDAYSTISGLDGQAGSSQIALQSLRELFPGGPRAVAEMTAFAKSKSLPRRVSDAVDMWASGELTNATMQDYKDISRVIYEFEADQARSTVNRNIELDGLDEEDAQRVREYFAVDELPPDFSGQQPVAVDAQKRPVYEHKGKYYYANGKEYKEAE